jgi:hypothetical protein
VLERAQVVGAHDVERFDHHAAAGARRRHAEEGVAVERRRHWLTPHRPVGGEIAPRQDAARRPDRIGDRRRGVAGVERRRALPGDAFERRGELRLAQRVARDEWRPVGTERSSGQRRPGADQLGVAGDRIRQMRLDREPVARQRDRGAATSANDLVP